MAGDPNMRRFRIQDCILRLTEKNLSIPVSRFSLRFALNELPTAQVIPAFGRVVFGAGDWASLTDIQEKDAVDLIIKVNDTQTLLLTGYISYISTDDTASLFARRQALLLKVTHRAVKLAGAPSATFAYSANALQTLDSLSTNKVYVNPFLPGPEGAESMYSYASTIAWMSKHANTFGYFPGHVLKEIVKGLFKEYNDPQMSQEDLDTVIRTYDPANVLNLDPDLQTYLLYISKKFSEDWMSHSTWEALVATAKDLFLQIIPFNTGFYIANPYALNRNPSVVIKAREYSKVTQGLVADLGEPKDGIVIRPPVRSKTLDAGGASDVFSFPNVILGKDALLNKYYHYRTFPAWIQTAMSDRNHALTPDKAFSPVVDPKFPRNAESLADYYKQVGGNLARAMYGELKQKQTSSTMVFPYRLDLMPGTNIQFDDSDKGISFIGDTTHGMVTSTTMVCDNLAEDPILTTSVEITALRNSKDNDDDELTSNGHPVFAEQWVGIDIEGKLLRKLDPPVDGPVDLPGEWFAAPEGVNVQKPVLNPAAHNLPGSLNTPSTQ